MTTPEPTSPTGADAIRDALKSLPLSPGVYRMLNAKGDILYVGKAKQLKNRVSNYANINALTTRIMRMVHQVARVEWTVTKSEAEALLVEANLIKKHKPRYNILLKDDKSFPYLMFTAHAYPRIVKHRGSTKEKGEYFGPFASVGALNHTLAMLQKVFQLRPCADTIFKHRTRPCLQYQIKRCSGPCVNLISEEAYAAQLGLARDFLSGKSRAVQDAFTLKMQEASDAMQFERAAEWRDRIRILTQIQQEQGLRAAGLTDADMMALYRDKGRSCVAVFFFRQGLHFGSQSFHPTHDDDASDAEVMEAFLGQFYHSRTPPKEVLLSVAPTNDDVLIDALSMRVPYRVAMRMPQRGDKSALMDEAMQQAKAAHTRAALESASVMQHLEAMVSLLDLPRVPERIEVFDNSHIMGTHQLGAMIVATPDGFKKTAYRTFNRKDEATIAGDDLSMMREMMRRRFRGVTADSLTSGDAPELLLIDGGLTQLGVVREVLAECGLSSIPTVSIAKGVDRNAGREWFHMEGRAPFQLPVGDPLLHYLERLRDEAHRFAIGTHRNRRSRALTQSALDDIPGIGPTRKKALLHHFGSRAGVENATLAELQKIEGINAKMAEQIFSFFHQ
ncbi:MAG: excinuclease ABC subunit C [Alphaproteobacteria bacterium]|nr:excinuclease ABC subunit C [Alphaproteobacteria bacterium]